MARPTAHLTVESMTAGYGREPIVHSMSISVGRGEIVAVVGPNGAGKSTMLKAIVGAVHVSAGQVGLGGVPITNWSTDRIVEAGLGYVPQVRDVFEPLTVAENLDIGGYSLSPARLAERRNRVIEMFPRLEMLLRRRAGQLSGGERKMVAIARALMLEPSLLVLDEPTAGLSEALATAMLSEHMPNLVKSGDVGILLVEQKAIAALDVSDWAYVLVSGSSRYSGLAAELLKRPDFSDVFFGVAPVEATDSEDQPDGAKRGISDTERKELPQ